MKRLVIYPYKFASASARALAENVRSRGYSCIRVHPDRTYSKRSPDVVLNWGSHTEPVWNHSEILNSINTVRIAGDKLQALTELQSVGVPVPDFTEDKQLARGWLENDGSVIERKLLNASAGRGLVLHKDPKSKLGDAPMYTRYFKKLREYRVHVADGDIIDWQQKMVKHDSENVDYQIRNHANGWIFARDAAEPIPEYLLDISIQAVNALGLSFGAVDVGWNNHYGNGVVFEVNTAPGLEGETTLEAYTNFIIDHLEDV